MIVQEQVDSETIKTYSDAGMMIQSLESGYLYSEAYDPIEMNRQYSETEIPISQSEPIEKQTPRKSRRRKTD